MNIVEFEIDRLLLRQWRRDDFPAFAQLNADRQVMEFFPSCLSSYESDKAAEKCSAIIADQGWGFWALELKENGAFIGFTGLHKPQLDLPFAPCVEVGWRLARQYWGRGYATEAALQALSFGFEILACKEIVSFAVVENMRSRRVMERLGFMNTGEDFQHPSLEKNHRLSQHVLYQLSNSDY